MSIAHPPSSEAIRSLIRRMLEPAEFVGRDVLLAQVDEVEYVSGPVTMMRLRVGPASQPARDIANPVPAGPTVYDPGGDAIGGLLLWLDENGYIDCLEYWWVTDEMPTQLPTPSQVRDS